MTHSYTTIAITGVTVAVSGWTIAATGTQPLLFLGTATCGLAVAWFAAVKQYRCEQARAQCIARRLHR